MRSDDDTWDITSSVGSTALFVAAARALEGAKPEPVAVDPFAEVFCRAVGGEWADLLDGRASDNRLATEWGSSFVDYQAARTRFFDDYFEAAAQAGVRQIVVLAAGLDSRAYRLNWPTGTTVYELDQPQVLDFKRRTLASHGADARAAVVEVPVDLRDDWPTALRSAGLDPGRPSAWVAEGLLIYLPAAAQATLFAGVDSLAAPGSHVAVEDTTPMPGPAFEAAREREIADGEEGSFFTLVYNEQHRPAADWFADRGWRTVPVALPALLDSLGRPLPEVGDDTDFMIESVTLMRAVKD